MPAPGQPRLFHAASRSCLEGLKKGSLHSMSLHRKSIPRRASGTSTSSSVRSVPARLGQRPAFTHTNPPFLPTSRSHASSSLATRAAAQSQCLLAAATSSPCLRCNLFGLWPSSPGQPIRRIWTGMQHIDGSRWARERRERLRKRHRCHEERTELATTPT